MDNELDTQVRPVEPRDGRQERLDAAAAARARRIYRQQCYDAALADIRQLATYLQNREN